ncbi:uncharacterized protein RHO25_008976 [Cercospora beticola]|uniref:Protein kinase domain-containing protein n=2 Tax=Cercospora beticola TaxID=122368 RepID=A0ABZ0NXV9_CERBT|nr:hypothetical protein RHO25_008976 [Cercospora beticola]
MFKAESSGKSYVLKRMPKHCFDLSNRIAKDVPSSPRLRMHVDCKRDESLLVYDYYCDTFLELLQNDPGLMPDERIKIMQRVAEAVQQLHSKDWVHTDIKPDNIFIDYTCDEDGNKVVTNVVLGDFDVACKLKDHETRIAPHAVGNVMWRSPEGHFGMSNKASDIYSLGLVYLFALGAGDGLILNNYKELEKAGIEQELEVLTRHFSYFGPVPEGLYEQFRDEKAKKALRMASDVADAEVAEQPEARLKIWGEAYGEVALDCLSGMTNLDPKARLKIDKVVAHAIWQESASF